LSGKKNHVERQIGKVHGLQKVIHAKKKNKFQKNVRVRILNNRSFFVQYVLVCMNSGIFISFRKSNFIFAMKCRYICEGLTKKIDTSLIWRLCKLGLGSDILLFISVGPLAGGYFY